LYLGIDNSIFANKFVSMNRLTFYFQYKFSLARFATNVEVWLVFLAFFLLCSTVIVPISAVANKTLVYTRNGVTVAAWLIIAIFLMLWPEIHSADGFTTKLMKKFTSLALVVALVCFAKVILALLNLAAYINYPDKLIVLYYIGEMIAWIFLTIFFAAYFANHAVKDGLFKKHKHHQHHHSREFDKVLKAEMPAKNTPDGSDKA